MAKRAPVDEKPFRPVDEALVRSVMTGTPEGGVKAEPTRRDVPQAVTTAPVSRTTVAVMEAPVERPATPRIVAMPGATTTTHRRAETAAVGGAEPTLERRDREKRVLLTRVEERDVERLVGRLAGELRTPVKLSHVLRACITMVLHSEEELVEQARRTNLVRPGNGEAVELAEFERGLAQVFAGAFRDSRPMR